MIESRDEMLCRYLDGELSPKERAELELGLRGDPDARARLDRLAFADQCLRASFPLETVHEDPLARRLAETDNVVRLPQPRRFVRLAAAAAAVLAAGFGGWMTREALVPVQASQGQAVALNAALVEVLDRLPSGEVDASGGAAVLMTFETDDNRVCRLFDTSAYEGVACRADQTWQVVALVERGEGERYQTAGGEAQMDSMLTALGAGPALDPVQEQRLIAADWR